MLHYLHFDAESGAVTRLARFQLQISDHQISDHGARRLHKPWGAFDFVPGSPGEVLISQAGSGRLLYAPLPRGAGGGSDVFLFGQHTGGYVRMAGGRSGCAC